MPARLVFLLQNMENSGRLYGKTRITMQLPLFPLELKIFPLFHRSLSLSLLHVVFTRQFLKYAIWVITHG